MAPLNALFNGFSWGSVMSRLGPYSGWLGIALVTVVLLGMVFGAAAQAEALPAPEMQTATATPTPTATPTATPTPTPTPTPTGPTATVEEVLEKGLRLAEASPVHLAARGTGVSNSTRCD
jgi:hypothetical protein